MKAFEINLRLFVGHTTKRGCCGVLKDQWWAIAVGFVISTTWLKAMRFHGQTIEAWESVDAIRSKNYIYLGAISAFVPSFVLLLGPPLTAYCELLKIFGRKKMLSLPGAISAAKQRSQKVFLLRKSNLNFGQNAKSWGALSFYGSKLGYVKLWKYTTAQCCFRDFSDVLKRYFPKRRVCFIKSYWIGEKCML